ncbi:Reverse transcriptase, RNA-dependent DNA polymerase domain-containing protein [Rozella allomycis CSF55]|uniref:Reverse transcriptase, RNA-dependent DNA polymerase domain-containing protein n=1 Tax=Rozella allomycis (strain CSF55) TaxID=988480 RepID=A0A075AZ42_ROZAC|nr:Reverse transcriptase, RNA-dependent DNA polymerase domain-containing protein [Rozella allomycis CSF55]|eukprot:EPZ35565.1 Reverse transcriptase, RNA-dependent DNA polymerase domain-containing protein [Rozella allomycis CSF55]
METFQPDLESKAWRLLNPSTNEIIISRDVTFLKNPMKQFKEIQRKSLQLPEAIQQNPNAHFDPPAAEATLIVKENWIPNNNVEQDNESTHESESDNEAIYHYLDNVSENSDEDDPPQSQNRYIPVSERWTYEPSNVAPPGTSSDDNAKISENNILPEGPKRSRRALNVVQKFPEIPAHFKDIKGRPDEDKWMEAIQSELKSHRTNGTWSLQVLPQSRKAIGSRWVFRIKRNADGSINKYKARLVALGYMQTEGLEFQETFTPLTTYNTFRILLTVCASQNLEMDHVDIKTAFLIPTLDDEIYMKVPEGVDGVGPSVVCKLEKSLYGLKQAPHVWNTEINNFLTNLGFQSTKVDACLYYANLKDMGPCYINLYVDDIALGGAEQPLTTSRKKFLNILTVLI